MKSTWLFTFLLLLGAGASGQTTADCKHRIFFLPQTHALTLLGNSAQAAPGFADQTLNSQLAIAQYLNKHRDLSVFSEQVGYDLTLQSVKPDFRKMAAYVKTQFPDGVPSSADAMNDTQKDILIRAGGDLLSFILRNTETLHRVYPNAQVMQQVLGKVADWQQKTLNAQVVAPPKDITDTIFTLREGMALDQINAYFKAHPSQRDAILIYGSDHSYSLRAHSDKFPSLCILTPYEFQSAQTSPYGQVAPSPYGAYTPSADSEAVGSSRVDLQACKLEYSIVSPK